MSFDPNDPAALEAFYAARNAPEDDPYDQPAEEEAAVEVVETGSITPGTTEGDKKLAAILGKAGIKTTKKQREKIRVQKVFIEPAITPFDLDYGQLCKDFDDLLGRLDRIIGGSDLVLNVIKDACKTTRNDQICNLTKYARMNNRDIDGMKAAVDRSRREFCPRRNPSS